jgi:hypothetical protein
LKPACINPILLETSMHAIQYCLKPACMQSNSASQLPAFLYEFSFYASAQNANHNPNPYPNPFMAPQHRMVEETQALFSTAPRALTTHTAATNRAPFTPARLWRRTRLFCTAAAMARW